MPLGLFAKGAAALYKLVTPSSDQSSDSDMATSSGLLAGVLNSPGYWEGRWHGNQFSVLDRAKARHPRDADTCRKLDEAYTELLEKVSEAHHGDEDSAKQALMKSLVGIDCKLRASQGRVMKDLRIIVRTDKGEQRVNSIVKALALMPANKHSSAAKAPGSKRPASEAPPTDGGERPSKRPSLRVAAGTPGAVSDGAAAQDHHLTPPSKKAVTYAADTSAQPKPAAPKGKDAATEQRSPRGRTAPVQPAAPSTGAPKTTTTTAPALAAPAANAKTTTAAVLREQTAAAGAAAPGSASARTTAPQATNNTAAAAKAAATAAKAAGANAPPATAVAEATTPAAPSPLARAGIPQTAPSGGEVALERPVGLPLASMLLRPLRLPSSFDQMPEPQTISNVVDGVMSMLTILGYEKGVKANVYKAMRTLSVQKLNGFLAWEYAACTRAWQEYDLVVMRGILRGAFPGTGLSG